MSTSAQASAPPGAATTMGPTTGLDVWIDQDLCTGDGICVQLAPDTFELDIDGLAYVKDEAGALRAEAGARVPVPVGWVLEVLAAAKECPGECIFVTSLDGTAVAGPDAG